MSLKGEDELCMGEVNGGEKGKRAKGLLPVMTRNIYNLRTRAALTPSRSNAHSTKQKLAQTNNASPQRSHNNNNG